MSLYSERVEDFKRELLFRTLRESKTVSHAAKVLGIPRSHLHKLLKHYGYQPKPKYSVVNQLPSIRWDPHPSEPWGL